MAQVASLSLTSQMWAAGSAPPELAVQETQAVLGAHQWLV